jgi:hypothetical protein
VVTHIEGTNSLSIVDIELSAIVDRGRCLFEFTDWRAEAARDEAVRMHSMKEKSTVIAVENDPAGTA